MHTPRLPVVDWTDAHRRFKWTRPFRTKDDILFLRVCHHISTGLYQEPCLFPGVQRPGPDTDHPPSSSAGVGYERRVPCLCDCLACNGKGLPHFSNFTNSGSACCSGIVLSKKLHQHAPPFLRCILEMFKQDTRSAADRHSNPVTGSSHPSTPVQINSSRSVSEVASTTWHSQY